MRNASDRPKIKEAERRMGEHKVKASYDKSVDVLYLLFKEGPSHEVIEADTTCTSNLTKTEKSWE